MLSDHVLRIPASPVLSSPEDPRPDHGSGEGFGCDPATRLRGIVSRG